MDLMLRMVRDVPGVAVYLQNQSSPDSEIVLPPSKRKETDAHIAYAELMIMSLINENGGVCSIRRVRTACILLSSKEDLMRSAPSGMKRIVKKWINQVKNYVPLEIWHVAINDLLDKQVLSRDVVQGELVLKIQPNIPLDDLSSDEWLSFEARSVLKIIEHKNSGFSEQLEQSLPSQEREKLKVA